MFSRNLLRSSSVWFHFGKRIHFCWKFRNSNGNLSIYIYISDAFPLWQWIPWGDNTKRTDEDAVKSATLPNQRSSWPNCTNDPSSKFLLPLPGFQTEIVPFAVLLSEPQGGVAPPLKLGNQKANFFPKLSSLPYMSMLMIFRCLLRTSPKDLSAGFWLRFLSQMQNELDLESTHLASRIVSPPFHSSVTSTPSSFRGFSSCFLSCHCESVWEVWCKGWVSVTTFARG